MAREPKALSQYFDPPLSPADVLALQAVHRGEAVPDQQRRALEWILYKACRMSSHCFVPGDPQATVFLEGRRAAGVIIANALKTTSQTAARLEARRKEGEQG